MTHDVVTNQEAEIINRILPERGLNEVFVGELDSTEPSFLEIEVNRSGVTQRIKCSGILVSTGTGSTAWSQAVGKITKSEIEEMNRALLRLGRSPIYNHESVVDEINRARQYHPGDANLLVSSKGDH